MAILKYKTRGNSTPQGKPRVYFCCHPEDFNRCFESISNEILAKQNCAVWYTDEVIVHDEDFFVDLKQMQLFVMPVTTNLLCTENQAIDIEFKFAIENHIPVLPLMQESGLEELFNKRCGDLQFLDKNNMATESDSSTSSKSCNNASELYRCQYLEVALRTPKPTALSEYLKNVNYDASFVSLVIRRLVLDKAFDTELATNFNHLTSTDIRWMITELYDCFSDKKIVSKQIEFFIKQ